MVEEQVNLAKCAILGLRKSKVAPNIAEEVGASVEETRLGSPVPGYAETQLLVQDLQMAQQ